MSHLVDTRYHLFCLADPLFYDTPLAHVEAEDGLTVAAPVPDGWAEATGETWRSLRPPEPRLPAQGWKIHVSATGANAGRVLGAVHRYCAPRRVAFKHLRSRRLLLAASSKYAPRAGSGKFVTLYPVDEDALRDALEELSAALDGEPGPYVLSDLRHGRGPLYTRYGGFTERWLDTGDTRVLAVRRPDGTLVPDRREPRFRVPDWVPVPGCLAADMAARRGGDRDRFPYTVTEALHFSNGGGVYRALRRADGRRVVLKEARPHAGLDGHGTDAVDRLHREHRTLLRLAGVRGVAGVHELFTAWEHHFLAMREMPGVPLTRWLARHHPLAGAEATEREVGEYATRALALAGRVAEVIAEVHRRGVVIGDLHPANILVDDDDAVSIVDFEVATEAGSPAASRLGAPGFRAPAGRAGVAVDAYALAALRLWLFLPLTPLLELTAGTVRPWVEFIQRRFGLPAAYGRGILAELATPPSRTPRRRPERTPPPWPAGLDDADGRWEELRGSIAAAILASATPDRADRLFPGDIRQFELGALGYAHGAAGVLHALHVTGAGRFPEHERWLLDALDRAPELRPGFFHGGHGVACVLAELGHRERADRLAAAMAPSLGRATGPGLEHGLGGIGLALLWLATHGERGRPDRHGHRDAALAVARRLAAELADPPDGPVPPGGLERGWSGAALLFVRCHQHTGERGWLELADRAVHRDLDTCVGAGDTLQVRDEWSRALPYLGTGAAGIALAAAELAAHAPDAPATSALPRLLRGCHSELVVLPGLLAGRAGLLLTLAAARHRDPATERALSRHLGHLGWHAVPYRGGVAFPGQRLLRLSMDLGTGAAGVLLALHAALAAPGDRASPGLPFLGAGATPAPLP